MFLAQNVKKFLKENFQEPKNSIKREEKDSWELYNNNGPNWSLLNDNDPSVDPACKSLLCNIYNDDKFLKNSDEK